MTSTESTKPTDTQASSTKEEISTKPTEVVTSKEETPKSTEIMTPKEEGSTSQEGIIEKVEARKKATELLAQGKRNMVCGEIPKAVTLFEEAVKILVDGCGELSYDCAEAYFSCGSALLELGRMENSVLGAALDGGEDDASEDGDKEDADTAEGGDTADDDTAEDADTADADTAGEETKEGETEEKDGDNVGNFQLAWEYLDLSKVIYLKSDTKEDQLKAAECHLKLGEVSMETELHEQAAEDLSAALKIQQNHLDADDRLIAETHYTLGLAYGLGKDFDNSITHYKCAVSVIEARIATLSKLVEEQEVNAENKENKEEDPLKKFKDEIKDLKELLPEMQNKIEDSQIEKKEMSKMVEMAKAALGLGSASTGFTSSSKTESSLSNGSHNLDENGEKKASDIAHLVKRKRRQEDTETAPEVETKKICKDNADEGNKEEKEEKVNGHVHEETPKENGQEPEPMTS